jgi:hypothetical protein
LKAYRDFNAFAGLPLNNGPFDQAGIGHEKRPSRSRIDHAKLFF